MSALSALVDGLSSGQIQVIGPRPRGALSTELG